MSAESPDLPAGSATPPPAPAMAGKRLGAWRLLHALGRGGMGEVWLAERADGLYESRAAIKLLRADLSGPGLTARFARERALLGRLTHPGIARLLDAGMAGEQAYLVLEHVPGLTLGEHVATRAIGVGERVQLLLGVARAVEHAHGQLVVHRDLKPNNVMVTPDGTPKLLDFGVAGLLDEDELSPARSDGALTRLTGRRLTPAYAAPEQILGEPIGVAADVYGLGVMLYELLTGALPYTIPNDSRQAVEHAVLHSEPRRLTEALRSTAQTMMPPGDALKARGDLEAIAAKALHKRPQDRYASVRAFIDDLERWQRHVPVSVRQEIWQHRLRLWLHRNTALAVGATAVTLALGAGLGLSVWQWQRAQAAAQRTQHAMDYLTELLSSANPQDNGGRPPTVIELLDKSQQDMDTRFAQDPELQIELLGVLSHTNHALGRMARSIQQGERLLALARQHGSSQDQKVLDATLSLALAYNATGVVDKVVTLLEPIKDSLRAQADARPNPYDSLLQALFSSYVKLGQFERAEAMLPEIRRVNERSHPPGSMGRAAIHNKIALLRYTQGRFREAEQALLEASQVWSANERADPVEVWAQRRVLLMTRMRLLQPLDFPALVHAYVQANEAIFGQHGDMALGLRNELAQWFIDQGRHDEAAALRTELLDISEARGVSLPALRWQRQALAWHAQALAHHVAGRPQPASLAHQARSLAQDLRSDQQLTGPNRAELWMILARIGLLLDRDLAQEALRELQADPRLDIQGHATAHSRLVHLLALQARQEGDLARCLSLLTQRIQLLDRVNAPQQMPRWRAQLDHANTLLRLGDRAGAQASLVRADALRPASLPPDHLFDLWRQAMARGDTAVPHDG